MLDESTDTLRRNLYRITRTNPESQAPNYDPEAFKKLVSYISEQLTIAENQCANINHASLIAALTLDFVALYSQDENLALQHADLGLDNFDLSMQRTAIKQQRADAGFSSGAQRKAERKTDWAAWQSIADNCWNRNPRLSNVQVGQIIADMRGIGENPNTIRKQIKKTQK